jgi:hypothetical protein
MVDGPRGTAPAVRPRNSPIDMTSDNGQSSHGSLWHRWLNAPQKVGLRRVLFQVHLWIGLALSVYVRVARRWLANAARSREVTLTRTSTAAENNE